MSARTSSAAEIVARYAAGYFPLYDVEDRFYWERLEFRALIPVTPEAVGRARKLARRGRGRFLLRHSTAVERVIALLQHPLVKSNSWVRAEVVALYRTLHAAGLLQTIEAWDAKTGELAGALLGIVFPGTFIAETMFSLQPEGSKVCLCELLENAHAAGHRLIDVQTPHDSRMMAALGLADESSGKTPHPCIRLGEQTIPLARFLRLFHAAAAETFPGTLADWLGVAWALAAAARQPERAGGILAALHPAQLAAAFPMLKHNHPPADDAGRA